MFHRQNDRKEIDTFFNANDSRFEPIQKSPENLSSTKKVTGLYFKGYKERTELWPETDQATFYNANKEATMKKLTTATLNWKRMGRKDVAFASQHETPEDCYDYSNAVTAKTKTIKPRSVALSDFTRQKARDDQLLNTSDAF